MTRSIGLAAVLVAACSANRGEPQGLDAGVAVAQQAVQNAPARRTSTEEAVHAFDVAASIADRGEPWLGGALRRETEGLRLEGERFVANGRTGEGVVEGDLDVTAALDLSRGLDVSLGKLARFRTHLQPVGASATAGAAVGSRVSWHDVYPSTDALLVMGAQFAELAFLLRDAQAPRRFELAVTLPKSIRDVAIDRFGDLAFNDASGDAVFHIRAPFVVDAAGTKRAAKIGYRADRVVIELDPTGLAYPLVLDPTIDVAAITRLETAHPKYGEAPVVVASSSTVLWSITGTPAPAGGTTYPTGGEKWTTGGVFLEPWTDLGAAPGARRYGAGAIDGNGQIVIWGGWNGTTTSNWTWYNPSTGAWSGETPYGGARVGAGAAPFKASSSIWGDAHGVVFFGGNVFTTTYSDVTIRQTNGSMSALTPSAPSGAPGKRSIMAMAGNGGGQVWLAAGEDYSTGTLLGDTWQLSFSRANMTGAINALWTPICSSCGFSARQAPASAYDVARQRMIMFGGTTGDITSGPKLGDIWELSTVTKTWTAICGTSTTAPCGGGLTPRSAAGMTCRAEGTKTSCYILGGTTSSTAVATETFRYSVRGGTCTVSSDCDTGSCIDGTCCESVVACGTCKSCAVAGSEGVCSFVPSGTTYTSCPSPSACNGAGSCLLTQGQSCTSSGQCLSGFCADGYCCNTACGGACDTCAVASGASANGTCTVLAMGSAGVPSCAPAVCNGTSAVCPGGCSRDSDCSSTSYCGIDGKCHAQKALGSTCNAAGDCFGGSCRMCASSYCTDGVCCDRACDGLCEACSAARKGTTMENGVCGFAAAGESDRLMRCPNTGTSETGCKTNGLCSGSGSCQYYSNTTSCGGGSPTCVGNSASGKFCDGVGTCATAGATKDCGTFKCRDGVGCPATCGTDADCVTTAYCDGTTTPSTCKPKSTAGIACTSDNQCADGFCSDGVCCGSRCDKPCEACNIMGSEGKCAIKTGPPAHADTSGTCTAGDPSKPCEKPSCDGTVRDKCIGRPGADQPCGDKSCKDNTEYPPSRCDGMGACKPVTDPRPCAPFACALDGCKSACTADSDCLAPATCDVANGKCVTGGKCDPDGHTSVSPDGTMRTDCAPFICEAAGRCKNTCASSTDCVAPNICDPASSQCVAPPSNPDGGGGDSGGCTTGRGVPATSAALLALVALALVRRVRAHSR